jgi:hypothetical protein
MHFFVTFMTTANQLQLLRPLASDLTKNSSQHLEFGIQPFLDRILVQIDTDARHIRHR